MKRLLKIVTLLSVLGIGGTAGYFYLSEAESRNIFRYVPDDFIYMIESNQPIKDWQELSGSTIWQYLKTNEFLGDVAASANSLDSLLNENKTVIKLISLGNLLISSHMTKEDDYDFTIMVDLKGISKVGKFSNFLSSAIGLSGYQVSESTYNGETVLGLLDEETKETLYLTVSGNILVASYTKDLLKKALDQFNKEVSVEEIEDFKRVKSKVGEDGIYELFINYSYLDKMIRAYTSDMPEILDGVTEMLSYTSFGLTVGEDNLALRGYTRQMDSIPSFLNIYNNTKKGQVHAHRILPKETGMFMSMAFDEFDEFYREFDSYYESTDKEGYDSFASSRKKLEKFLKLDMERDFFSWMTDEIAMAIIPTDQTYQTYSHFAIFHFDDYKLAQERMNYVTKMIKKRSPVKFETVEHKGYEIKYLKLKGFFKLFFKKMFGKIEKPHYTFLDDYVVFSNDVASLQFIIDKYLSNQSIGYDQGYARFAQNFDRKTNIFTYIQPKYFYNYTSANLDWESRRDLAKNRKYFLSFPRVGFHMSSTSGVFDTHLYGEFDPVK